MMDHDGHLMHYTLDAEGMPVPATDSTDWAAWHATADRRVAQTEITPEVLVSTVFLAMDHRFIYTHPDDVPILWETLVFGGVLDGEMDRYETLGDARRGHDAMCLRVIAAERAAGVDLADTMDDLERMLRTEGRMR